MYARAARILGYSDARIAASGSALQSSDLPMRDRTMAALRDAIGANTLVGLMNAGAAMSEEQAVEEALSLQSPST